MNYQALIDETKDKIKNYSFDDSAYSAIYGEAKKRLDNVYKAGGANIDASLKSSVQKAVGNNALQTKSLQEDLAARGLARSGDSSALRINQAVSLNNALASLANEAMKSKNDLYMQNQKDLSALETELGKQKASAMEADKSRLYNRLGELEKLAANDEQWKAELLNDRNRWQSELADSRDRWQSELADSSDRWQSELANDKDKWNAELADNSDRWKSELADSSDRWKSELADSSDRWKSELADSSDRWQSELANDNQKWNAELADETDRWKSELANDANKWMTDAQNSRDKWNAELAADKEKWQAELADSSEKWKSELEEKKNSSSKTDSSDESSGGSDRNSTSSTVTGETETEDGNTPKYSAEKVANDIMNNCGADDKIIRSDYMESRIYKELLRLIVSSDYSKSYATEVLSVLRSHGFGAEFDVDTARSENLKLAYYAYQKYYRESYIKQTASGAGINQASYKARANARAQTSTYVNGMNMKEKDREKMLDMLWLIT